VIDTPLPLLYNDFAIVVGLLYAYLPFMILTLYASIARLGPELREASADLGAGWAQTFVRVTVPLTVPGIAAGCVFVFVLSIGNFITPDLLGGGRRIMVGNLIYDQFLSARDWPFGASLAFILIGIMMMLLFAQAWLVNRTAPGAARG
jgi:spermidine/putrescine transport system permease protein